MFEVGVDLFCIFGLLNRNHEFLVLVFWILRKNRDF